MAIGQDWTFDEIERLSDLDKQARPEKPSTSSSSLPPAKSKPVEDGGNKGGKGKKKVTSGFSFHESGSRFNC